MEPKKAQKDEKPVVSPEKDEAKDELSEKDLETVSGGKVSLQGFHFTKKFDKASPN